MAITPKEARKRVRLPENVTSRIEAIVDRALVERPSYTELATSVICKKIVDRTIRLYQRAGWNVEYVRARYEIDIHDEAYLKFSPKIK